MAILNSFTINKNSGGQFVDINHTMNKNVKVHSMRPLQEEVFVYRNEILFTLSTPQGSGKSTMIKFVCTDLLINNPDLKIIISMPTSMISKSFGKIILEFPDKSQCEWDVTRNLFEPIPGYTSKINTLESFINKKQFGNELSDRVAIVSHITLSRLYKNIDNLDLNNTMFVIDEAHHVLYPENGNGESANQIGKFISHLLYINNPTIKIWFVSATFFRGDRNCIIPPEEMDKFTLYHLPLDVYWSKYLKYIESFSYDFITYKDGDILNEVENVLKLQGKKHTIIFCPYIGQLVKNSNKIEFRDKLISIILKVWPKCRIIDLVEEEGRHHRKDIIINDLAKFDIVLSVRLFDEGSDWAEAESILDLSPSNSLRIVVQRFGRLLRPIPGKTHINYSSFFPYEADFENEEDMRQHFSKSYNAFTASLLLHNSIDPVPYPNKKPQISESSEVNDNESNSDDEYIPDPLTQAIPDESIKQTVINEIEKNLMFLRNTNEDPSSEEVKNCIVDTLHDFNINENEEELATYIAKIIRRGISNARRPDWKDQTVNVDWMTEEGFDKVWTNEIFEGFLAFTSGISDINTFKEFRDVYGDKHNIYDAVHTAEILVKNNNGVMPSIAWRNENGYGWLQGWIYKYPEKFSHIHDFQIRHNLDDAKKVAEMLAKNNNGSVPTYIWRTNNGYGWLNKWLFNYPEEFSHINLERDMKTIKEVKNIVKTLAENNNGKLPTRDWRNKNGYGWIENWLYRYPEEFSHILIEKWGNNIDDAKKVAEILFKNNNGVMPSQKWRNENGYGWLQSWFMRFPEEFSHIYTKRKRKDIKTAKSVAKLLKDNNNGVMPSQKWRNENGYGWLQNWLIRYPEEFKS